MQVDEELNVELAPGVAVNIKYKARSDLLPNGHREVGAATAGPGGRQSRQALAAGNGGRPWRQAGPQCVEVCVVEAPVGMWLAACICGGGFVNLLGDTGRVVLPL